jgi:hypothetical protein
MDKGASGKKDEVRLDLRYEAILFHERIQSRG